MLRRPSWCRTTWWRLTQTLHYILWKMFLFSSEFFFDVLYHLIIIVWHPQSMMYLILYSSQPLLSSCIPFAVQSNFLYFPYGCFNPLLDFFDFYCLCLDYFLLLFVKSDYFFVWYWLFFCLVVIFKTVLTFIHLIFYSSVVGCYFFYRRSVLIYYTGSY